MFNVLTSKDKEFNLDMLMKLYDYFCGEYGVDNALRNDIINYLERTINFSIYKDKEIDDEYENDISKKNKREIIVTKLNIFKKRGCLIVMP